MSEPTFDIRRDHRIDRNEAVDLVHRYQAAMPAGSHLATAFNASAFRTLLSQPGCEGIRIYRALHEDGSPTLAMVGVDVQGLDIKHEESAFMQGGQNCPPVCFWDSIFHHPSATCVVPGLVSHTVAFDPNRVHSISKSEITQLVRAFQVQAAPDELHSSMYHRSAFEHVLDQPDCAGIRIYLARHNDGQDCMVFVGVTAVGDDLTAEHAKFAQAGQNCPPFCFDASLGFSQAVVCQAVGHIQSPQVEVIPVQH
ncbi:hypothetical protein GETHLI_11210 [Geothrix limicola]|uniref:Uncharacterized protein n=1 Tax=Geothrix limicola TaxID=2927978 RepID=A0ABQ5QDG5_9BACT|nr:hypothetical protein [Geothrix limicola]GLH72619.1 hypothetical protein GETHLI_11210 [Geothrix limicola]